MIIYPKKTVKICSTANPSLIINAGLCNTFYTRLAGFMFRTKSDANYGLLFDEGSESKINSAIHMFFMNFNLTILWLDSEFFIVDKAYAKKWHPFYMPAKPARYVLEIHESKFNDFFVGDKLELIDEN